MTSCRLPHVCFLLLSVVVAPSALGGCLDRPTVSEDPTVKTNFEATTQTSAGQVDLLFMIDNSTSMGDKQKLLSQAVPNLVNRLVQPNCLGADGITPNGTQVDPTTLTCASGTPEFPAVRDLHIGIVSSSLGDFGVSSGGESQADSAYWSCPARDYSVTDSQGHVTSYVGLESQNDHAQLLNRTSGFTPDSPATATPVRRTTSPGSRRCRATRGDAARARDPGERPRHREGEPERGLRVDGDRCAAVRLRLRGAAGELVPVPRPAGSVGVHRRHQRRGAARGGEHHRPAAAGRLSPSALAGRGHRRLRRGRLDGRPGRPRRYELAVRERAEAPAADRGLRDGSGVARLHLVRGHPRAGAAREPPGVRAWPGRHRRGSLLEPHAARHRRRQGQRPLRSHEEALRRRSAVSHQPLRERAGGDERRVQGPRSSGRGDPRRRRLLRAEQRLHQPALRGGAAGSVDAVGERHHRSAGVAAGPEGALPAHSGHPRSVAGLLRVHRRRALAAAHPRSGERHRRRGRGLHCPERDGRHPRGDLDAADRDQPRGPRLQRAVAVHAGVADRRAPGSSRRPHPTRQTRSTGREWDTDNGDLEYACTFDLPTPFACSAAAIAGDQPRTLPYDGLLASICDCSTTSSDPSTRPPLCTNPSDPYQQTRGKAYPGIRELTLVHAMDQQPSKNGIAASLCPRTITTGSSDPNYGYNPAVEVVIAKLKSALGSTCIPRDLTLTGGQAPCTVLELLPTEGLEDDLPGDCDPSKGLSVPLPEVLAQYRSEQKESGNGDATDALTKRTVCQLNQLAAPCFASDAPGWCYETTGQDPTLGTCLHAVKISGTGTVPGALVSISCVESETELPDAGVTATR